MSGPASALPRLRDLIPADVGRRATELLAQHIGRAALPLSPGYDVQLGPCQGDTDLGLTVAHLCEYAQAGTLYDWTDDADANEAIATVLSALYRRPIDGAAFDVPILSDRGIDDRDTDDPIEIVLLAAYARSELAQHRSVPDHVVATLASVGRSRVNQLVGAGEIRRNADGRLRVDDVVRWLGGRGIVIAK